MTFAEALTALLAQRGTSQRALARQMGLSGAAVNDWCTGITRPGKENTERLEDVLDVQPRGRFLALLGYAGPAETAPHELSLEERVWQDDSIALEDRRFIVRFLALARADKLLASGDRTAELTAILKAENKAQGDADLLKASEKAKKGLRQKPPDKAAG